MLYLFRPLIALPILLGATATAAAAEAPDALPYRTTILPSGDAALDAALAAVSELRALEEAAPTSAFGILGRAAADRDRLRSALASEGYWGGTVAITLGGQPLGAAALPVAPAEGPLPVEIRVTPGPAYRVSGITLQAPTPEGQRVLDAAAAAPFGLAPGDPARAGPVLAAEALLLDRLLQAGHPLATLAGRETVVDHDTRSMEILWRFAPGPAARFAPPAIAGATRVDPGFLRRQAGQLAGQPYTPARLEEARRALFALGPFASVTARAAGRLDPEGRLPVTFLVADRPRHALGVAAAYETNYGPALRLHWEHRNLLGGAERLRLEGEVARLATPAELTFRSAATLRSPGVFGRDLTLAASLGAVRERLDAYDRDAATAAAILERRLGPRLTLRAGPTAEFGAIGPPGGKLAPYQIAGVLFGARWDTTDSLLDPARGLRADAALTPSLALREGEPFAPLRLSASGYLDVSGDRRSILALRGAFASLAGAGRGAVPRHLRFYAGGGGSVRGYDFQSIGPRDDRGRPSGGASLLEASVEWRQRVFGDFGVVGFLDAGTVGTGSLPDTATLRAGAGLGLRYYTAIGPIRADVALPLVRQQSSAGYGIYVGIGQAF